MRSINLKTINIGGGTQSRVELNEGAVADYTQVLRDGGELPPVVVFFDGADNWLADGFHRFHAYRGDDRASIPADVRSGTKRDAMLFSFGANGAHGLRRSNEDKRKAVRAMLDDAEWSAWSDRKIAEQCGVGHPFVAAIRSPIVAEKQQQNRAESATKKGKEVESDSTPARKVVLFAAPVADTTADQLSEAAQTISSLSDEVDELRDKLAVENMDATEAGKTEAAEIIADLREQLRVMRAELGAMRISRDRYQAENAELMKQIKMNKRELDKARAA